MGEPSPSPEVKKALPPCPNISKEADLRQAAPDLSAPVRRAAQEALPTAEMLPDLAQVAASRESLPEAVKAGILAMVTASLGR